MGEEHDRERRRQQDRGARHGVDRREEADRRRDEVVVAAPEGAVA